ncbi:hypothetical protein GCM10023176_02320 [Micromonospora coerulea]|uniref:Uncharacterized protein n=1 Tax=Micromonospora coerulea TaxID=47856 RepID=A0ABP8S6F2_9ACTN
MEEASAVTAIRIVIENPALGSRVMATDNPSVNTERFAPHFYPPAQVARHPAPLFGAYATGI